MLDEKVILQRIRDHRSNADFSRRTNEKALPELKFIVSDVDKFEFGNEDLDLKQRLIKIANTIEGLEIVGIKEELLESLRVEASDIKDTLLRRYKDRMDAYATRQGHI